MRQWSISFLICNGTLLASSLLPSFHGNTLGFQTPESQEDTMLLLNEMSCRGFHKVKVTFECCFDVTQIPRRLFCYQVGDVVFNLGPTSFSLPQ